MVVRMEEITRLIKASIVIILDTMLISALILLFLLDKLVNEILYNYGLVFSLEWAEPYWNMMRASIALIVIVVLVLSILEVRYPLLREKS
jgi:hypothetical protein